MPPNSSLPAEETLSDEELMAAIALGDEAALQSLYQRHSPAVFALCLRILDDRRDAEEVLLEVFFEIWDRADRYQPTRGAVRTYVVMLARSRAIDRVRKARRRQAAAEASQPVLSMWSGERLRGDTPSRRVTDDEQRRLLVHGLNGLDEVQREVLELAFFEGLSHREIAARLETPLGTIKTRIRRALRELRGSLASLDDGRGAP